jgi:mono/diheme cytochrome c family protein
MNYAVLVVSVALVAAGPASAAPDKPAPQAAEFFEKNVRPVLAENCYKCHGPKRQEGDVRLDSRAALLKGNDKGAVVVPGEPDKSRLIRAVGYNDDVVMPPTGKLKAEAIEALTAWVKMGAPWPDGDNPAPAPLTVAEARAKHWSFRPVKMPPVPAVKNAAWVQTPVDAFVLANLEKHGVTPAPPADRRTLIRRAYFDLLGLPPAPEEVEAFVKDDSPEAWPKLIDRLLSSPQYGERWGRHWLDVARYADTRGYVFTEERRFPYSYTYRDYVIRAFNDDLPYDRFVLQQLAADRLELGDDRRPLAALGFLTLGRRFLNNQADIIDDRIDVTMRGLQGMTVSCARCHDHKFDPIPQKDYYSLYGVFASSVEPKEPPSLGEPERTPEYLAFEAELKKREDAVKQFKEEHKAELEAKNRKFRDELTALEKKVEEWRVTGPGSPPRAMALEDAPKPVNPVVFKRGNPNNHGDAVPRQYLEVLAGDQRKPFTDGSGRLELAQAIASKDNPLTARVMVNRIWGWHFGAGLVRTPSDFGLRGEPPTHPELLDWLAASFMENGWSVKKLHRVILLSNTYRQSSDADAKRVSADPENRLLARMNRQRLDFEALRDSLLATAGRLDAKMGGPAVEITKAPFSTRRTVYGFIDRQNLPGVFRTFDFASPDATVPQRYQTTVPQQALFLMNSPFVIEQAKAFAARPDVAKLTEPEERIDRMHRLAYGRPAEAEEIALAKKFLAAAKATDQLTPWEQYAQVLLLANEFAFVD